ncbi:retinaldehyde-binding protein 1-like isoform X2 [Cylas formicarius]|nr:retinaldehyde-binding protein 1-like isoform X2 [Cylas formicarius]
MSAVIPKHNFNAEDVVKTGRTSLYNIAEIRKWLTYMPAFPAVSDEQIVLFLLACNDSVEFTKSTITYYFKHRAVAPEFFSNRDVDGDELTFTLKVTKAAVMPNRTRDNMAVVICGLRDTSYSNFYVESQIKVTLMLVDLICRDNPANGFIFVINLKGVGIMHVTRLKLSVVKKFFQYLQEALPIQLKQIHILNTSFVFDRIISVLKPFMHKDLYDMIITHPANMNKDEFFKKHIPADCMPSDFYGSLPDLDTLSEHTRVQLRRMKEFFEDDEQQMDTYRRNRK